MAITNLLINHKEKNTWKYGLIILLFLAPFFFLTYGFANDYASSLNSVPSIMFDWEKHIPLWPWTIVPYWSIDLFYGLSLLLCWNKFELKQHALRLFSAQVISITCFSLFPLKFSMNRPELHGFFGMWFDILMGFDKPFNQAPSLHIVLLVILWDFYRRHSKGHLKYFVDFWSILIGISVLTTWQHHFIDIPTGVIVGAICLWLFPISVQSPFSESNQKKTNKHLKLGIFYLLGSALLIILSVIFKGYILWLLYPALSLLIVAIAYLTNRVHLFQKQTNGDSTIAAKILFAPYILFAFINSRLWTKKNPNDSFIIEYKNVRIYLGRFPSTKHQTNYDALFDCCAEIPRNTHLNRYTHYSTLDLIPVQSQQFDITTQEFNRLFDNIRSSDSSTLLIYCALGYSRSSAILIAWLVQQKVFNTVEDALNTIKTARPWIVLSNEQIQEIAFFHQNLESNKDNKE